MSESDAKRFEEKAYEIGNTIPRVIKILEAYYPRLEADYCNIIQAMEDIHEIKERVNSLVDPMVYNSIAYFLQEMNRKLDMIVGLLSELKEKLK